MKNSKNVVNYLFGAGSFAKLPKLLLPRRNQGPLLFILDHYFKDKSLANSIPIQVGDHLIWLNTTDELTTDNVDQMASETREKCGSSLGAIVGIGGGSALDAAKAVANMMTNPGKAEDYQGWDLVKFPGIYKIGIPTLSGTGAEASRTCVMMNYKKNLKLGMNSEFTVYDQLILDPELTSTVPRMQYFYSGMDTYIHCLESLAGSYRNAIGDAFSVYAHQLCEQIFLSVDMQSLENREKMMVASYFGGCAIGNSFVGIVHPFSAALSVVFGIHHCEANCIALNALAEFYPKEVDTFRAMMDKQQIRLRAGIGKSLTPETHERLYLSTVVHEKPLKNALGENFLSILAKDKVRSIFEKM